MSSFFEYSNRASRWMLLVKIIPFLSFVLCLLIEHYILIAREPVIQLQHLFKRPWITRASQQMLLFSLLLGSLAGALCSTFYEGVTELPIGGLARVSLFRMWLRSALFPTLMAAALISRKKTLFPLLFFIKGAAVVYTLCVFSASASSQLPAILPTLILESVMPLPFMLWLGGVWADQAEHGRQEIWLLPVALVLTFFAVFLKILLF